MEGTKDFEASAGSPSVVVKSTTATASGGTAVWTPAAGKKFRLMGYQIQLTANAAVAAGAVVHIDLFDGATFLTRHSFFVPTTAVTTTPGAYTTPWIDLGNGFLSSAANNGLSITLSAALTSGEASIVASGSEE